MKKICLIALVFCLGFNVTACGNSKENEESEGVKTEETIEKTDTEEIPNTEVELEFE